MGFIEDLYNFLYNSDHYNITAWIFWIGVVILIIQIFQFGIIFWLLRRARYRSDSKVKKTKKQKKNKGKDKKDKPKKEKKEKRPKKDRHKLEDLSEDTALFY